MSDDESAFSDIEAILKRAIGLDVASIGRSSIEKAVRRCMAACACKRLDDYAFRISSSGSDLQDLIEAVVVPETWFNRDAPALDAMMGLARTALEQDDTRRVRVLSIPCSTGEEPYSVAMAIEEAGLDPACFRIDAVDISRQSLERARSGIYGHNSFRGTSQSFKNRHFTVRNESHEVAARLRRRVRFHHGNLLDAGSLPGLGCYDFILCRNLLIYFDRPTQEKALAMFDRLLCTEGVIFVGPAESSLVLCGGFASARIPSACAFRRATGATSRPLARSAPTPPRPADAPRRGHSLRTLRPTASIRERTICADAPAGVSDADALLDAASRLADQGRYREAIELCHRHLRESKPSARTFHLLGLIEDAAGRTDEAQAYYRKAVYLEPTHAETLMQLAHHARRLGDSSAAERFQERAQRPREGATR